MRQRQARLTTRLGFEFLVLTAARSGEVRGASWKEIRINSREWCIPQSRMKAGAPHTVPLSDRCLEILDRVHFSRESKKSDGLIFPGAKGQPMSDMIFTKLIRDMGYHGQATAHGFRSSFKVWAAEKEKVRDEVSEAALAHKIPEKVRAAYLRTQFLEERRDLMNRWSDFVTAN